MHETVESTAVIDGSLERVNIVIPHDFAMPEGGLNIRLRDTVLGQEARLHDYKRDAMLAFVRANKLNRIITSGGRKPKIGIITVGKSYLDVRQALDELGIDEVKCQRSRPPALQDRLPVADRAATTSRSSPTGLDLIIVVEEKRSLIEVQVREELYGTANQPVCIGKKDEQRQLAVPGQGRARSERHRDLHRRAPAEVSRRNDEHRGARRARSRRRSAMLAETAGRRGAHPLFLLGLPAQFLDRRAGRHARLCRHRLPLHGAVDGPLDARASPRWAARARTGSARRRSPSAPHVFQNLGDGTYNHSGSLAIRAAIAVGRQHHLQDPLQRRRRHDRRPGQRRRPHGAADRAPGGGRRRQARRRRHRRAVEISAEHDDWPRGLTIHHRDELDRGAAGAGEDPGRARC